MKRHATVRGGRGGERGMTLVEVVAAMAIGSLVLSTIYLALGTAVRARLLVWGTVHNQQHGRLVIQWIADRLRQAGYSVDPSSLDARCQDALVAEDAELRPSATALYFNTDLDGAGAGLPTQTVGFRLGWETAGGSSVPVVEEWVRDCTPNSVGRGASITDPTAVTIASLTFAYYDAAGVPVTALGSPAAIRTIRMVRITLVEQASVGGKQSRGQTWSVLVHLRNPNPRTL